MQQHMEEMQRKYEEELRTLHEENVVMRRAQSVKNFVPLAPTQPVQTGRREEPCQTAHKGNSGASKDHPSMETVNTVGMLHFTLAIMKTHLPDMWTILVYYKYDGSTNPNKNLKMFTNQITFFTSFKEEAVS